LHFAYTELSSVSVTVNLHFWSFDNPVSKSKWEIRMVHSFKPW